MRNNGLAERGMARGAIFQILWKWVSALVPPPAHPQGIQKEHQGWPLRIQNVGFPGQQESAFWSSLRLKHPWAVTLHLSFHLFAIGPKPATAGS